MARLIDMGKKLCTWPVEFVESDVLVDLYEDIQEKVSEQLAQLRTIMEELETRGQTP